MTLPSPRVMHPHVEIASNGIPFISGTRVPVRRLWAWHSKGVLVETLVKRYPSLGWARVLDALAFAYDNQELVEADLDRERVELNSNLDAIPGDMKQQKLPFDR